MKKPFKKLSIKTETIKQLDNIQLSQVAGAMTGTICVGCSTGVCPPPETIYHSNCVTCQPSHCLC